MNDKFLKQAGIVFSLLFFVWIPSVVAQRSLTTRDTTYYRKAVYVELAGNGISESLNYEMRLSRGRRDGIGFRAGLGLGSRYATKSSSVQYLTIPLMANYILGSGRHAVEGGIGFTPQIATFTINGNDPKTMTLGFLDLGYRFQPVTSGLLVRATFTPIFNSSGIGPWVGASVGYSFDNLKRRIRRPQAGEQPPPKKALEGHRQALGAQVLGTSGGIGLFYDRLFSKNRNDGFGFQAGVGKGLMEDGIALPIGLNYIVGNGRHSFYSSLGYVYFSGGDTADPDHPRRSQRWGTSCSPCETDFY